MGVVAQGVFADVECVFALFDDVFDAIGVEDTTRYMMRPDSPEFQQAQQQQQQQAQQEQQKVEEMQQMQVGLAQSADKREWKKFEWNVTNDIDDNTREDRELDHTIDKDKEELQIERTQKRAANIG